MKYTYILLFIFGSTFHLSAQQSVPDVFIKADAAYEAGNYEELLTLKDEIINGLSSGQDSLLAEAYLLFGDAHLNFGELDSALLAYQKERSLREKIGATHTEDFSRVLFSITYIQNEMANYTEAKKTGTRLLKLDEELFGRSSDNYINSVIYFSDILINTGEYDEAKKILTQTMRASDKDNPMYPYLLNKEADIHSLLGNYSRAEKKYLESLKLIEQHEGVNSAAYASASGNLAMHYIPLGKFPQAEELIIHSRDVLENIEGMEDEYISAVNNLALVHIRLNQQEKSLEEFKQVLAFDKKTYGENHPYLASTLSNIGTVYNELKEYQKAEEALAKAVEISGNQMGKNSMSYAIDVNNLASMYRLSGQPEKSVPLYATSMQIIEETVGKKDPDYLNSMYNLGLSYYALANNEAEKQLKNSLKGRKRVFSKIHPRYAQSAERLAYWYWHDNDKKNSAKYFEELFNNYYSQIDTYFPALSEEEKVNFFINKLKLSFESFDNFVLDYYKENPDLIEQMLDHQLNTKALIMYATNKVRESIINSGDSLLINQYESWLGVKEHLSRLFSSQSAQNEETIDSLNTVAETLEKELGRKSSSFSETYLKQRVTWKDVQAKLKDDEAVIEIIRFRDFSPEKGGSFTDEVHYVALLFTNKNKHPELISIPEGGLLEKRYINNYRNAIQFKVQDEYSYDKLWRPIGDKLGNAKRIYFSPDGVYNQVSINTLYNPKTGNYLLDEIEIRVLTNSKDLLVSTDEHDKNNKAYLLGYPNYNMNLDRIDTATTRGGMRGGLRGGGATEELTRGVTRGMRAGLLRYMRGEEGITMLPGTKEEVENISKLYNGTEIVQETVLNDDATEHFIKSVKNPKTLHIATHGFFLPDVDVDLRGESNKYVENPLLRSGLILAGAGDFLISGDFVDTTMQDGILTAYEAMNLNLDQTELVVLSACETGLGEIKNGEGVYGLQRAFLIAGADNIIMSMWSVDDDATQELMSTFYREWIRTGNKQDSFRSAQQQLREKYKDPFYWGAFIMVGI